MQAAALSTPMRLSKAEEAPAWYAQRSRLYFYDQYVLNAEPAAFSKYDPDRVTRELPATVAYIIVIYAANQFSIASYPSRIWPQHPNLRGAMMSAS